MMLLVPQFELNIIIGCRLSFFKRCVSGLENPGNEIDCTSLPCEGTCVFAAASPRL